MSRVSKRAGTKALVCMDCQRNKSGSARTVMSFRGQSAERLQRHIREVHRRPRTASPGRG